MRLLNKIFKTQNDRELKRLVPKVQAVSLLEPEFSRLSDLELAAKTPEFRNQLDNGESLDNLLVPAFATVREAMKRAIGKRLFDVQILGGSVLHEGRIAEMKTGEGKTFVATLPSYLNALAGKGVHVITVNDYLARRDAEWMAEVHALLGMSVGVIVHNLDETERMKAYNSDITYGTNNEFAFDYLRDNMKPSSQLCVQGEHFYAIVDEVDSILIDEARTPLIISGPSEENTRIYGVANQVIPRLKKGDKGDAKQGVDDTGDFWVDEEHHSASLTDQGVRKVEKLLSVENLYDPEMLPVLHAVQQSLTAHALKRKDVDYVVKAGEGGRKEVIIVDEFTGRLMPGRRWSDGLHQAVEAMEGIQVQSENQTLASVTFQNFFRMYKKLSGMTGTADTEAPEFAKIYDLDVTVVPTNCPMLRQDMADVIYKTGREKFDAIVEEIQIRHESGQPILVGTISIENSEKISRLLKRKGVKHNILNAKQHEREAEIVAQAGRKGAVTISTNMAGRGTDIVLGGNPEFLALEKCGGDKESTQFLGLLADFEMQCEQEREEVLLAGGLHILGTERHESRRIDNQLRGRSGRQGDPGSSQFYLALDDDLLRIFGGEKITPWMERLGLEEGEAIEHKMISRAIENAQGKVESRNFDIRKHLLEYDDVMNKQRQAFYGRRRETLEREDLHEEVLELVEGVLVSLLDEKWPDKGVPDDQALLEISQALEGQFGVTFDVNQPPFQIEGKPAVDKDLFGRGVFTGLSEVLDRKRKLCDEIALKHPDIDYPSFEIFSRSIILQILDRLWKDHLHGMDALREGINLRGYAQRDPKIEYQREGFAMFDEMSERADGQAAETLFKFVLPEPEGRGSRRTFAGSQQGQLAREESRGSALEGRLHKAESKKEKVGRNDPCPCGSGKKFKRCHGG